MKRIAYLSFAAAFSTALLASTAGAQSQSQSQPSSPAQSQSQPQDQTSLGDLARKARKDSPDKSKPKVYDNDNLPKDDKLSIVGEPAPAAEEAGADKAAESTDKAAADKTGAATKPAASPEEDQAKKEAMWKEWQKKIASQKDQIDLLARELDVLQREYQIRAAAMYADVGNRLRNSAQWDKQDAQYKQQIADKQKSIDDAKQKLDDTQEEARKAGVPSGMLD
jgi:hypothetical protein